MQTTASGKIDTSAKALAKLSWPIFVELILQLLVGNMDQVQLSHFNDTAVAAVGNANQIITVVILTFSVVSLAAMILISQYRGAGDMSSVNRIYTLSALCNLVLSTAIAVLIIALRGPLFAVMHVPAEILPEARAYLVITAVTLPFQALMLTFSAFLRAGARMKSIMAITGIVNVCNILGNAVLINGVGPLPRLGAAGAALSSSIFRVVGFALMVWVFFRSFPEARIAPSLLRPWPRDLFRRLIAIGVPSGGESLSYQFTQMSCLVFVNMMGTYVVTTRMYTVMLANCIYLLISAVSQAGQVTVGYLVGARDLDGADRCTWRIVRVFCPLTVGISALVFLAGRPILGLLSGDERVIALGCSVLLVEILLEIGRSFNIVLVRSLQAAGDVKFPTLIGIASEWIVAVGLGYLFGIVLDWGLVGMWAAFAIDENLRGLIFIIRWKQGKWRSMKTV